MSNWKRKLDFSEDIGSGSERGDNYNKCIGGIHRCKFFFIHIDVHFDPLFCIMAMWHANFCNIISRHI